MAEKKQSFESAIERLEEIVHILEGGSEGLDASLKLYEEGIGLIRSCTALLENAELKVRVLRMQEDGAVTAETLNRMEGEE